KLRQFYYAIGNSPATNIFLTDTSTSLEKVKPIGINSWRTQSFDPSFEAALNDTPKDINVLCLACGDLRNILYSMSDLSGIGKINLFINDYDVHVLARNILILDAIFEKDEFLDEKRATEAIFCIWFSTGLKESHSDFLHIRLERLIDLTKDPRKENKGTWSWSCYEQGLLESLQNIWQKWLNFFASGSKREVWEKAQDMRHENMASNIMKLVPESKKTYHANGVTNKQKLRPLIQKHWDLPQFRMSKTNFEHHAIPQHAIEKWEHENRMHMETGLFIPGMKPNTTQVYWRINPTLFWSESSYDLHYGTDSFKAFPYVLPSSETIDHVDHCFAMFQSWICGARDCCQRLSWTFSTLDCQTLCLNFDQDPSHEGLRVVTPSQTSATCDEWKVGDVVRAHGLQKSPHLNSCYGILVRQAPVEERWGVHFFKHPDSVELDLPKNPVSIKKMNLQLVEPSAVPTQPKKLLWRSFDVITTSNVADHIGLSTILLLTRPLLKDGGVLLTTTFLKNTRHGSTKKFLQRSLLNAKPQWWATLFGFRPLGYESDAVASPACKVVHSDVDHNSLGITKQSDSTMVWLATVQASLSVDPDGPIMARLNGFNPDEPENLSAQNSDGKLVVLLCRLSKNSSTAFQGNNIKERNILGTLLIQNS
ncbi:hypothetical protein ACHAWF_007395, partial [Thalassiosira exigua]